LLELDMSARRIYAHPSVRANAGKVALQRGPLVYCLEEADNGAPITSLMLPADAHLSSRFDAQLLGGCTVIEADGWRDDSEAWGEALYQTAAKRRQRAKLTFIPYYLWANRGEGEMAVWVREI